MFRLFEYSDLAQDTHEEAFKFVTIEHWNQWLADCTKHFGGPENIISLISERPGIATDATSKSWSRILQTAGSKNSQTALSTARKIANSRPHDPLVPKAIKFLESVLR